MARTLSWKDRIPALRERVAGSVREVYTRRDLEALFEIGRAAAGQLMHAIGQVNNVGGAYHVDRASLLAFLERMGSTDEPEAVRRELIDLAEPAPRPRYIRMDLPEDLRSIMVRDLPDGISLSPGRVEILGADAEDLAARLILLAQALTNDLGTAAEMLNPPPAPPAVDDDEFAAMFADLRRREAERAKS